MDQKGMNKRFKIRWTLEIISLHSNPGWNYPR